MRSGVNVKTYMTFYPCLKNLRKNCANNAYNNGHRPFPKFLYFPSHKLVKILEKLRTKVMICMYAGHQRWK